MENKIEAMRGRLPKLKHLRLPDPLSRPAALNYAIERAQGRYIGILDDDNYYELPHLEVLRKGVDRSGADLIYTGVIFRTFTPEGQLISESVCPMHTRNKKRLRSRGDPMAEPASTGREMRYERRARALQEARVIKDVITHRGHFRLVAESLIA
jgi:glycosyltransferase involved in cell wall biosynthesis